MFYFALPDRKEVPQTVNPVCLEFMQGLRSVCCCSLEDVRELVCWNRERKKLWLGLEAFLAKTAIRENFSHLNLVGPYVSKSERPRIVHAVLETRAAYGPAALAALLPFFELGLDEIRAAYGVRLGFWVEGAPSGLHFERGCFAVGKDRHPSPQRRLLRHGIVRIGLNC